MQLHQRTDKMYSASRKNHPDRFQGSAPRQVTHTAKSPLQVHFSDALPTQKANVSWGVCVLLFYTRNSPVLCIYFLKSAGIKKFPLLGSPAGLWSISGHSDLEHTQGRFTVPGPQPTHPSSRHQGFSNREMPQPGAEMHYMTRTQQLSHL